MRTAILGVVLVVSVAALTSCASETTSGQPRPESASSSSAPASADAAAIDTGDYSTTPRALAKPASGNEELARVESQRMAEFTTLPAEIDPTMTAPSGSAGFVTKGSFKRFFVNDDRPFNALTKLDDPGLIGGFHSKALDPNYPGRDAPQAYLGIGVMRFSNPAAAITGARTLSESRTAPLPPDSGATPFKALPLPSMPETLGSIGIYPGVDTVTLSAITPYKGYVILEEFQVKPDRQAAATALLPRGLSLQKALIDKFPATQPKKNNSIVVDQNKILLYTLPDADSASELNDAVLGPRGIAASFSDPVGTMELLTEMGSLHNATALTTVFRAETAEGAQKIFEHETEGSAAKALDAKPAASPPGLPQAKCTVSQGRQTCDVVVGRYVGEANGNGNGLDDAHRRISAQYKILLQADQNAN